MDTLATIVSLVVAAVGFAFAGIAGYYWYFKRDDKKEKDDR